MLGGGGVGRWRHIGWYGECFGTGVSGAAMGVDSEVVLGAIPSRILSHKASWSQMEVGFPNI